MAGNCVTITRLYSAKKTSPQLAERLSRNSSEEMPSAKKIFSCQYGPTNTYLLSTPIGEMELISCPKGLHSLTQVSSITDENFMPDLRVAVVLTSMLYQDNGYTYKPASHCIDWLKNYFQPRDTQKKDVVLPAACPSIGKEESFTFTVWKTLQSDVPFGMTVSYARLGAMCGNTRACHAVGQAMRLNPLQLVIPCHRVIQADGRLGNYSSGRKNKVKEWLLTHEEVLK